MKEVIDVIEKKDLDALEHLSEWWLEHEFKPNLFENEKEFEFRKDFVLPAIINEKLNRYEEDY